MYSARMRSRHQLVFLFILAIVSNQCGPAPVPAEPEGREIPDPAIIRQHLLERLQRTQLAERMTLNGTTAATLWTPGEQVERIVSEIPPHGVIDTAIGIDPATGDLLEGEFRFGIGLTDAEGRYREVLDQRFDTSQGGQWYPLVVDLADWSGQEVELIFSKRFVGREHQVLVDFEIQGVDLAAWARPRIRPSSLETPNVILISLDTLRPDHLSVNGYRRKTSRHIDAMAAKGVVFAECISQAPWTTPAHYSMLSGAVPSTAGATSPVQTNQKPLTEVPMLAEVLSGAGYQTVAFTGQGGVSADLGFDRGFDLYDETPLTDGSDIETIISKALGWTKRNHDRSFFMFVHSYEPHEPFTSEHFIDQGTAELTPQETLVARYDGDIREADAAVGLLLEEIDRPEASRKTIVVVTSDHGEEFFEDRIEGFDSFARHGHSLYDELLRVPLIMKGPGIPPRTKVESQVRLIDIAPTIIDLLGLEPPSSMEGTSLHPWILGQRGEDLPAYSEGTTYGPARDSLRTGDFKIIRRTGYGQLVGPSSRFFPMTPREEIYDLNADPRERVNLANNQTEQWGFLREALAAWGGETGMRDVRASEANQPSKETMDALRSLGYLR